MSRTKGKVYERKIAAELRLVWPTAIVRRASQAERADNPDVFIEGGPPLLARLWLELQDARTPTPLAKLEQAEADCDAYYARRGIGPGVITDPRMRLPVVVWHRLGERTSYVTCRLWVLDAIRGHEQLAIKADARVATVTFEHFVGMLVDASTEVEAA